MKRALLTSFAAAALSVTITAGVMPNATAVPAAKASQTKASETKASQTKAGNQTDKRVAAEKRAAVQLVATKDAALLRAIRTTNRAGLTVGGTEVLENIDADRLALGDLKDAVLAAHTVTEVRTAVAQIKAVRPEVYSVVVNGLRQAASFEGLVAENTEAIAALDVTADMKALEGFDVTTVRDALIAATIANDTAAGFAADALSRGVLLTAFSTKAEREAFSSAVAGAGAALDDVEAQLQLAEDTLAAMLLVEAPVS